MNKLTRILTLSGMGAIAALAIAGPAQAASSNTAPVAKPATVKHFGFDRETVGYYRSPGACELAGRIGERLGRWDDHDCDFVRFGFHRGSWALEVSERGWGRPGFPDHGRPGFPGGPISHGPIFHGPISHGPILPAPVLRSR